MGEGKEEAEEAKNVACADETSPVTQREGAPSKHSRSARRATSPGIDLDKSLKNVKPPSPSGDTRPSVLGIHQAAGVTKKAKKTGRKAVLSAKARRRQERGLDHAAAVMERTVKKVERSKSQSAVIQSRSKEWTEINTRIVQETGVVVGKAQRRKTMFAALANGKDDDAASEDADSGDEAVRRFYADLDEDMGEQDDSAGGPVETPLQPLEPASIPLPVAADGDEDIL